MLKKNIDTRKSPLPVIITCIIKTENRDLVSRCDNVLFLALPNRLYVIYYLFVLSHILGFQGNKSVFKTEMILSRLFF